MPRKSSDSEAVIGILDARSKKTTTKKATNGPKHAPAGSGKTCKAIAAWMLEQLEEGSGLFAAKRLRQTTVVRYIRQTYGDDFVYRNQRRNWAIVPEVLEEFRKLTPDDVVWSRGSQMWRSRKPTDPANSRMVR